MIAIEYKGKYFTENQIRKILNRDNINKRSVSKLHTCDLTAEQKLCVDAVLNGNICFVNLEKKEGEK